MPLLNEVHKSKFNDKEIKKFERSVLEFIAPISQSSFELYYILSSRECDKFFLVYFDGGSTTIS